MCGWFLTLGLYFRRKRSKGSACSSTASSHEGPPAQDFTSASWNLPITDADVNKLLKGFTPIEMENRWAISATERDEQGNFQVHITRSWTGLEVYLLKITIETQQTTSHQSIHASGARISEIEWDQNIDATEEEAKTSAAMLCKGFLACELNHLP